MKNKKMVYSWVLYDWANSAFATTVLATILPIYYKTVICKNVPGNLATSYWGYTTTIAMLIVAVLSPILGATADKSGSRKKFFKFFAMMGIIATGLLFFTREGQYVMASMIFIVSSVGFSGGNVFYDAFLPLVSPRNKMDFVSTLGYSAGYLGGGLLLIVNMLMINKPELFGIADALVATRLTFITVAIWWFLFSIPAFKNLPKDRNDKFKIKLTKYTKLGFAELKRTLTNISKHSEIVKFLIAFWLYNDGVGTIIRMATIYGAEIGIGQTDLIGALLMTQFIAMPFAILFGKIGEKIGSKKGILITLFIYLLIVIKGYFLDSALDFWMLGAMVGTVQGGVQALSRSFFGSMVPKSKTSEFFGFYGVSSKFAAITGPFVFALVGQLTGSSRLGIISIALFFIIGIILLSRVDWEKGKLQALEAEKKLL